ncbi:hypothetical protein ACI0FT_03294 [Alcaligenes nematophilus]
MPGPESSLIGRSLLSVLIYAIELLPKVSASLAHLSQGLCIA